MLLILEAFFFRACPAPKITGIECVGRRKFGDLAGVLSA